MSRAEQYARHVAEVTAAMADAQAAGLAVRMMDHDISLATLTVVRPCRLCGAPFLGVASTKRSSSLLFCTTAHETTWHAFRAQMAGPKVSAAERERLRICPRPDKEAWGTLEGAQHVVGFMRAQGKDPAGELNAYWCLCRAFHVGNRVGHE